MRPVPETYALKDWPRKVARNLNEITRLYAAGELGGSGVSGGGLDMGDSGPQGAASFDMGDSN